MKKLLTLAALLFFIIFTPGLTMAGNSTEAFQDEYDRVKAMVDKAGEVKEDGGLAWRSEVVTAFRAASVLYKEHPRSADTAFLVARCYYYNDRPIKATRALKKTFYYDAAHVGANILKGDIAVLNIDEAADEEDFDLSFSVNKARRIYEGALDNSAISDEDKSLVYLKLGNLYDDYNVSKKKSMKYWEQAVASAPDSSTATEASKKLAKKKRR